MSKAKTKTTESAVIPAIVLVIALLLAVEAITLGSTGQAVLFGIAAFFAATSVRKTRK